jgi:hypothetical protein
MKKYMKLPMQIAAQGTGLMVGSMVLSNVSNIAGPSAAGINNMAQMSMGMAGLVTAAKGVMDATSMLGNSPRRHHRRR